VGFSQIVLAREMTLTEIRKVAAATDCTLEFFIHGALCVAFSGQCYISHAHTGRSANRGECSQACRLPYDLTDKDGNLVASNQHLLSMKDNNQSANLRALADAGISSFKIEGRYKDMAYVKNITAHYRLLLDEIMADTPEYSRTSAGRSTFLFQPLADKTFNRGATDYFVNGRTADIGAFDSPKFVGEPVGSVIRVDGKQRRHFDTTSAVELHNGDGLSFYDRKGELVGLRVNRAEKIGEDFRVHTADPSPPSSSRQRRLPQPRPRVRAHARKKSAERRIAVDVLLTETPTASPSPSPTRPASRPAPSCPTPRSPPRTPSAPSPACVTASPSWAPPFSAPATCAAAHPGLVPAGRRRQRPAPRRRRQARSRPHRRAPAAAAPRRRRAAGALPRNRAQLPRQRAQPEGARFLPPPRRAAHRGRLRGQRAHRRRLADDHQALPALQLQPVPEGSEGIKPDPMTLINGKESSPSSSTASAARCTSSAASASRCSTCRRCRSSSTPAGRPPSRPALSPSSP
jgi:putative protease